MGLLFIGEFGMTKVLFDDAADMADTGVGAFEVESVTDEGAEGTYGEWALEGPPNRDEVEE